jgi:signal transduction histidine kinase
MNRRTPADNSQHLSQLAHDLRDALATIQGRTQLVQRRLNRGGRVDSVMLDRNLAAIDRAVRWATRTLAIIDGGGGRRLDPAKSDGGENSPPPRDPPSRRA